MQEVALYLRRLKQQHSYIIGGNEHDGYLLDANTVHLLQDRCAGLSSEDRAFLQSRITSGELFPAVREEGTRAEIYARLCSMDRIIISLHTLLEDSKILEPCARILKRLLPSKCSGSLSQHFQALHNGESSITVQISEFETEDRSLRSSRQASWIAYRQLWLFVLRHFPSMDRLSMDRLSTGKDIGKERQPGAQYRWWVELSLLSKGCGYQGIQQIFRDRRTADLQMIQDCIHNILPPEYYEVDRARINRAVKLIYGVIGEISYPTTSKVPATLTSDRAAVKPRNLDRRAALRMANFQLQPDKIFFDHIYSTGYDLTTKRYLTRFAFVRDFFHNFFGMAEEVVDQQPVPVFAEHESPQDGGNSFLREIGQNSGANGDGRENDEQPSSECSPPTDPRSADIQYGTTRQCPSSPQIPSSPSSMDSVCNHSNAREGSIHETQHDVTEIATVQDTAMLPTAEPLFTLSRGFQHATVSMNDAKRFIFRKRTKPTQSFVTFFPEANGRFHFRKACNQDTASMIQAMGLPSQAAFLIRDNGKRLKLTAPSHILEASRSHNLDAAVVISNGTSSDLIRQLKTFHEPEQDPAGHLTLEGHDTTLPNGRHRNSITISIWDHGEWKVAELEVSYSSTEQCVQHYLRKFEGFQPFDFDGNQLSTDQYIRGALADFPPTLYLAPLDSAGTLFPLEL